tara:strand:+ start:177995 stop:178771 length:777 start_codon:yes stop_codon:yes gene_type:complete
MKHIKRKFLFHEYLKNHETLQNNMNFVTKEGLDEGFLKSKAKNNFTIIETDLNEKFFSFIYNNNGKHTIIPVPDFALVNFDFAYKLNLDRIKLKNELLELLSNLNQQNEVSSTSAYDFYGAATTCLICLFTSIECFINDIIPENYEYKIVNDRKTEIYNKSQIQYSISFNDKITKVLPNALNKNFFSKPTPSNIHIHNLRSIRNEIIHTKSDKTGKLQVEILKKLLKFKYEETFKAVFDFFNFYKTLYIEECPCENNW